MMIKFTIVVRELDNLNPDYWLNFEAPSVPNIGTYISINRLDERKPLGEDLIVRQVWSRFHHPETHGFASGPPATGKLVETFVECDQALGPYSSPKWRKRLEASQQREFLLKSFKLAGCPFILMKKIRILYLSLPSNKRSNPLHNPLHHLRIFRNHRQQYPRRAFGLAAALFPVADGGVD
jgi:hypothetical protein